jgi:hypothetical protein
VFAFGLVRVIINGRQSSALSKRVDVKRLPGFLQDVDQFTPRYAISDSQPGKAVNFRKCAQNDDVPVLPDILKSIRRMLEKFILRFIKHRDDILRQA